MYIMISAIGLVFIFALSLCKAAKNGDEQMEFAKNDLMARR